MFEPDGTYCNGFGGAGDGPREFGGPPWLVLAPPDTLVVWDPGHYRLSWYGLDGVLHRQVTLATTIGALSTRILQS